MPGPANATSPGNMSVGLPDVMKEPPPVVATVLPNISEGEVGVPFAPNILFDCMPAHNMMTVHTVSEGDDASIGGMVSGIMSGPTESMTGAFNVLVQGAPVTCIADVTLNNLCNTPGLTSAPSQVTVICV